MSSRGILAFAIIASSIPVAWACTGENPAHSDPDPDSGASDAGDELAPGTPCSPRDPFSNPQPVPFAALPANAGTPRLTPDEKSIYYNVSIYDDADGGGLKAVEVHLATRPSTSLPFSGDRKVLVVNGVVFYSPSVSADDRLIVVTRTTVIPSANPNPLWYARRGSAADGFTPVAFATNSIKVPQTPYLVPSGEALYVDDITTRKIYRADIATDQLQNIAVVDLGGEVGAANTAPVISGDEQAIYFSSRRVGSKGGADMYIATRANVNGPFDAPRNLDELNTAADEEPTWISPDGCHLYFQTRAPGGRGEIDTMFVASRQPHL